MKPIVSLKIQVFQNSGFPFYHYFWRTGFRPGFSLFIFFEVSGSDSSFLSDSTLVLNWSFLWRFEFFKTRVFHFIIIFEDPGSDSGFPFLFLFEVSGFDSSFLSDSTLVLKPIVSLKIRVFQNSGFPFYHYFWRSGFRLGFSLFIFVWSLGFRLVLPIGFNARVETDSFFEDSSFSKLGFSILWLFLKIRVSTRVFSFIFVWSLGFRLELPIGFNPRVETDHFFEDSSFSKLRFSILSLFLKTRVPTRVFPFYFRLKSRVPTRASYRIQHSCWNRLFLWRFEFFKTRDFHFIIIFEEPGSDPGFPFLFSFEVSGSDSSFLSDSTLVLNWSFLWRFEFFKTRVFHFIIIIEDLSSDSGFQFLFSFEVSGFESTLFFKTRVFHFIIIFQDPGSDLGFPFLFSFEVSGSDSSSLSDSTLLLKPTFFWRFKFFKTQVFHLIIIFEDPGSDLGFPFLFAFEVSGSDSSFLSDSTLVLKSIVSLKIRVFQNSGFPFYHYFWRSGFRLGFSLFIFVWMSRVPTRACFRIQRSCWNRSFPWRFEFFKTRVFHFIIIFEDPGSDSGFPFLILYWSLGFRLELPIGYNARVETDRFFEDSSFSKLWFSILSLFLKIRVPTRVFPFYFRLKSRVPTRASYRIQLSCWNRSFLWRFKFFKTRVFHFIIIFEDLSSDSGFPFLFSFEVSGSDSSFLSDSMLVLKPIVSLKIRVFQNSGFPFYHYFWRSGFRLGFSLFIFVWSLGFRVELVFQNSGFPFYHYFWRSGFRLGFSLFIFVWSLGFRLELPIGFNARVETDCFFEDSSFSKLGFSILSLFLKIRVPTQVCPFYFRLKSRVPTRASYRIQPSCWNTIVSLTDSSFSKLGFSILSIIFEDPGSDSGFPFLFSFEVSGSDSSFLSDSTLVLKPIVSLKIRVFQNSGFPFYHYFSRSGFRLGFSLFIFVWSLGFRLELPIGFNARVETDCFFEDSSFSKLGFSILSLFLKIRVPTQVCPFYFRLKSRVPTRASYRIQPSCWNRSFLWRFEFFKTRVFHFIIIFEDPGSDSGFPFLFSFEVSGSESSLFFKTRVFHFIIIFQDPGSDSGFPFLFSFEVSGSDSSFLSDSTLVLKPIVFLKIRVFQNSGFPFYHYFSRSGFRLGFSLFIFVWSLGFRLERWILSDSTLVLKSDRFFEDSSFSKLRFSILSLFFKIRVPTRVFPFYFRLKSRVPTRASYRIQRSCWNRSFPSRFKFFKTRVFHFIIIFEDPGSDSGFPFLFSFEVSGSDSSFLSDSTLVLKPIVSLKIRVFQNSGFPFYHYFWRTGFRPGFSLFIFFEVSGSDSSFLSDSTLVLNWSFLWRFEFFKTRVFHFIIIFEDPGSDSGFPFLFLFEVSGFDSSFLSDSTLVLKPIVSLKIRVFQNSGFPFYHYFSRSGFRHGFSLFIFVWSLGFRLELPIGFNFRVENDSFLWRFKFFKTRVFHFIIIFEDLSSDSGFPFLFSFEVSGSDSSFLSDSMLVLKPIVSLKI